MGRPTALVQFVGFQDFNTFHPHSPVGIYAICPTAPVAPPGRYVTLRRPLLLSRPNALLIYITIFVVYDTELGRKNTIM